MVLKVHHLRPAPGDYTASITWEWQYSSSDATTSQTSSPTGLIASGTRPA